MKNGNPQWTIDELSAAAASALAEGYEGPPNGRVRDVPDRRTIRYYTTLGLIDRPAEMRGRTAIYGRRHLLQLVAIKKLQARGQTLLEVQRVLAGITDKGLAMVAGTGCSRHGSRGPRAASPGRAARDFWRQEPAPHAGQGPASAGEAEDRRNGDRPTDPIRSQTFHGVQLVEGAMLLLSSSRPIDEREYEAIRASAAPLIDTLIRLQLINPREEGEVH